MDLNKIYNVDCLVGMKEIPDGSVDCIICDLPYGTTACKWDSVIPFEPLWEQYKRVIREDGAIVLFGSEPFSSLLRASNVEMYRYDWIWNKEKPSNFQLMNYQCGRIHELISVFSKSSACFTNNGHSMRYYPQKTLRDAPVRNGGGLNTCGLLHKNTMAKQQNIYTDKHPVSIISFTPVHANKLHPTEKPVDLIRYLVRTYTNPGETILDNCMGSGTTAVAAVMENRKFIGFETNPEYCEVANKRLRDLTGPFYIYGNIGI